MTGHKELSSLPNLASSFWFLFSSAPARGQLPLGPYSGAIIGGGGGIPAMTPLPYNTPPFFPMGSGDPMSGFGIPNQIFPNTFGAPMPSFSLPAAFGGRFQ